MTKPHHNRLSGWITLIFFTTLFVMSGVIISFLIRDAKQFDAYHQQISYQTIYSVSWELTQQFEDQQRLAELVAKTYQQPITDWINDINNPTKRQKVKEIIDIFFPQHYSFTLADHEGHALWDDLGENIGEKCLTELYEYSRQENDQSVRQHSQRYAISSIHPGPSQYHYDLFLPVQGLNEAKTLLVSFSQTALIEKLANRQSVNHHLMIVDEQRSNLIELTGAGGRDTINRSFNLEYEEEALIYEGIGGKKSIDDTHWAVVDMIDPSLRQNKQNKMLFGISLTIISTLLLAFIGDFSLSRYRHATEERENYLQETNARLEEEVAKRTQLLTTQKAQLKLAATVFEQSTEGIIITDANNLIVDVNQAMLHISGFNRDELIGQNPNLLNKTKRSPEFYQQMWDSLQEYDCWHGELEDFNSKKHHRITMQCAISAVRDDDGNIRNYIAIYTNITPLKTAQRALEHMAYYDRLTGLPNRTLLFDRLEQALTYNKRNKSVLAVCYLDLDGFKPVNDTLGHEAGDELLKTVSTRMESVLRQNDTVARLGGDEFVLLISDLDTQEAVEPILQRLMSHVQESFIIQDQTVHIGVSIGVAFYPAHGEEKDQLLRAADQAMYQVKRTGKNHIVYFDGIA